MAAFDFYTTADASIMAHPRPPGYRATGSPQKNVVYSETVGGKVRSQVRGADRGRFTLRWGPITRAHLESLLAWHATYGSMRQPFLIELPQGLTDLAAGTKLRVRAPGKELPYECIGRELYQVMIDLIEEVLSSIILGSAPATIVLSATGPTAVIISGSLTITPAARSLILATVNPTVRLGSTVAAPAASSLILATVNPTVAIDTPVTPAPAT